MMAAKTPPPTLADVLPAVAASLSVTYGVRTTQRLQLPESRIAVVLLIDGLGSELLRQRGGHAPFLRGLQSSNSPALSSGYPSTTATSMGMFGTGLLPGAHGLVGLSVLDPEREVVFSELAWDDAVDPLTWQPEETLFEQIVANGLEAVRIGPAYFDGSGLTEAVLRGGRFVAADTWQQRAAATVQAAKSMRSGVIYVYWGEVDKAGHVYGCSSWQWGDELTIADRMAQQIAEQLPSGALMVVTADHGMVDVPFANRLDLGHDGELAAGIRHVGGEPRALHLYCEPGATSDVLATWQERLAGQMEVARREDAIRQGWFGEVNPRVLPRIGDIVTSAITDMGVEDSRTARPQSLRLLGHHGARTAAEQSIPLLLCGPATT